MKFRKIACVALACLLLAGCGTTQTAEGDMNQAAVAVLEQDYSTAFTQAQAFLKNEPENEDAQVILQTAAWGRLYAEHPALSVTDGTIKVDDFGIYVSDLSPVADSQVQLTGFWVGVDYDREELWDTLVYTYYLRSMTLYWTDEAGQEHAYEILAPEEMTPKKLAKGLLAQEYAGDTVDEQTREELLKLAQKQVVPALKQLFKQIETQTGMTPEDLGFAAWN